MAKRKAGRQADRPPDTKGIVKTARASLPFADVGTRCRDRAAAIPVIVWEPVPNPCQKRFISLHLPALGCHFGKLKGPLGSGYPSGP